MGRYASRPEGSNWGDYGEDDELGRLNELGPAQVLKGVAEVKAGKTFCLSLPLDMPGGNALNPRRHPPRLQPTRRGDTPYLNFPLGNTHPQATDVISDDQVLLTLQYSTQWDAFAHVGGLFDTQDDGQQRVAYYNGWLGHEHVIGPMVHPLPGGGDTERSLVYRPICCPPGAQHASQALKLGIQNYAVHGIQGRAVLIDIARVLGRDCIDVGLEGLQHVMQATGVTVEPGDIVLLRTGFAEEVLAMGGQPDPERLHHSCAALDGTDPRLLQWITDSGIVALAADNYAVERHPPRQKPPEGTPYAVLPLHEHCLFKLGIPLGELWFLQDLADWLHAHQRTRCLLTAPPLRLPGAVGSPVTPIATV